MMKRFKLDGKTEEERMMEQLTMEEEKKGDIMLNIQGDSEGGIMARPEVNIIIPKGRTVAPK